MSEPGTGTPPGATQRLPVLEEDERSAGSTAAGPDEGAGATSGGPTRRLWASRRVPAAVVALLTLAGLGLLLYDIVEVRAGRDAMSWRRDTADGLATRPLDDTWVLVGAGAALVLGLWLLVLALTPGKRALLPMRSPHPDVHAVLDRKAAAAVLRDRAVEVPGVQSADVRISRSRAKVRAESHFRDVDEVRADVEAAVGAGVGELGMVHPPRVSVRIVRPKRKG